MEQYISKNALVAEIKRLIKHSEMVADHNTQITELVSRELDALYHLISFLDTLEVKEVDLNNSIQLTWEDIRELYIIFAEVDAEIEFCKTDIQVETIGYYQEVLKRFKAQKGE